MLAQVRKLRIAAVAISIFALASVASAQTEPQIEREMIQAYQAKNYDKALELGKKLIELDGKNATYPYNVACLYSLKGEGDNAIKSLQRAVELGFDNMELLESDADLTAIRNRPEYKTIVETAKKNQGKSLETYREKASKSEPLIFVPEGLAADKPVGCVVILHPFGGTAEWIVQRWKGAAKKMGVIVVAPRAVIPQDSGFRWQDVELADTIVMKALEAAKSKHKIDEKQIVISGFSEGASMTYALALRHGDTFCGAIPIAGRLSDPIAGWDDVKKRKLPRFVIMVGDKDQEDTVKNNREAEKKLEEAGAKAKLKVFPGVGHAFPEETDKELSEAVSSVIGG